VTADEPHSADEQQGTATDGRGKLKIYLGYAEGVGKTYAMLEAAQLRRSAGIDVVIGFIDTHGRDEMDDLLADLEFVPLQQNGRQGVPVYEMDTDAILMRRPRIALIDDLAHTNAPGSRHARRYQDVLELLDHGIDVYTTINVQQLESLKDVITRITGTPIKETVPDHILEEADEVLLVDLPIDELILRF
jgi:two-component system sensor histidine kinase KdpD